METVFSRADARAYDRLCMDAQGLPGIALMERAAQGCARASMEMLGRPPSRVLVVAGAGQNGGDGYAVATLLRQAGHRVAVRAVGEPRAGSDAATMRARAVAAGVPIAPFAPQEAIDADLIVDALFGTGLDRPVAGEPRAAIEWMNAHGAPVLSIDLPSGMDCDTGEPLPVCVRAARTVTMVARKLGFDRPAARPFLGLVEVVPIGGPDPGRISRS
jgi:NAD(P)H-hydrate epimerase